MYENKLLTHQHFDRLRTKNPPENPHACVEDFKLHVFIYAAAKMMATWIRTGPIKTVPCRTTSNFGHLIPRIGKITERNKNIYRTYSAQPCGKTYAGATFLQFGRYCILLNYVPHSPNYSASAFCCRNRHLALSRP